MSDISIDRMQRLHAEQQFANSRARNFSPEQQARWDACRSGHRYMAFEHKQVVIYRLVNGKPVIRDILTCEDLKLNIQTGLTSKWGSRSGHAIWLSHTPIELSPNCFMWHPKNSNLDFIERRLENNIRFSMTYRTLKNPISLEEGVDYILERAVFDNFQWPNK